MATTPTYSWPIPDDTDLVKDGAEAIRDLGNAIDTTVDGLPGAGLVHIETQTFSAVSAVNFSQDVFTSEYDNYVLIYTAIHSESSKVTLRLRVNNSDNSTSNYVSQNLLSNDTSITSAKATSTSFDLLGSNTTRSRIQMAILSPNLSQETTGFSTGGTGTTGLILRESAFFFDATTVFDSASLLITAGNFTGSVSIYGMRK
jgi:hypothetical protein